MPVAQKPEVAYLHEPVGEDVEEEPPDELGSLKGHDLLLIAVGVVLPTERDLAILHADDAVVRDRDPVGVPPEIAEDVLGPVEGRLGVNHPLLGIEAFQQTREVLPHGLKLASLMSLFEKREELPSEQPGHDLHGEEKPSLRGDPLSL